MPRSLILFVLISVGCGTAATETEIEDVVEGPFEAGDLDPYGCPYIAPVPWEDVEAHREVCGPGCDPYSGWARGAERSLVACVAEEVPRWPSQVTSDVVTCMTHPVDGKDYCYGTPDSAYPLQFLCWSWGERDGVPQYSSLAPPECLER